MDDEPADAKLVDLIACLIDAHRALNPDLTVGDVLRALETIRHTLTEGLVRSN